MEEDDEMLSLRARRKKPSVSLSCCFNGHQHQPADSFDTPTSLKLKGKCKSLISRMGLQRRHSSADFTYDPHSYSLNFQDEHVDHPSQGDDLPLRSFVSRLPSSPQSSSKSSPSPNRNEHEQEGANNNNRARDRAAAVAEVRKSSEEIDDEWKLEEMITTPTPTTPRIRPKVKTGTAAEVRRSYDYDHQVASPPTTSRQVLVKLC